MNRFLLAFVLIFALFTQSFGLGISPISRSRVPKSIVDDQFVNSTIVRTQKSFELKLKNRTVSLLNVPDVMQATDYTCGPSALSAVLNYFQLVYREAQLATLAKTKENFGTGARNLVGAALMLNISASLKQGMTIQDLQNSIAVGRPVIVLIQAWADQGTDYKNDWQDGHYVVVIGYDSKYLYFEDPWIIGNIGYIAKSQFSDRWHDQLYSEQRRVYNLGIIVNQARKDIDVVIKLQ